MTEARNPARIVLVLTLIILGPLLLYCAMTFGSWTAGQVADLANRSPLLQGIVLAILMLLAVITLTPILHHIYTFAHKLVGK